eukprot:1391364-Pyramimonas_sp.AAC.1
MARQAPRSMVAPGAQKRRTQEMNIRSLRSRDASLSTASSGQRVECRVRRRALIACVKHHPVNAP